MVRQIDRRKVLKGAGAATIAGLAGCLDGGNGGNGNGGNGDNGNGGNGNGGNGDGAADIEPMIGILQPESGDLGDLGTPIADGAELPAIQLENEGSDVSVDVRREDTETDPNVAVNRAEALVDAGYPAITGAAASDSTITAAQDVFFPNEVVAISPASTSPDITDMEGEYLLRTCPSDAWQGDAMADIAVEEEGAESISTLYLNNDYGQGLNDTFVAGCEDRGAEVLEEIAFESQQPSYSSELESAFADDPDLLMVVGYPESGEVIFRDFYSDIDDGTTIMVPDGLIEDDLPANVDNPMENVIGTAPGAAGPGVDAFEELYEEEYGRGPAVFNSQAYDATAVLILATVAGGEVDGTTIAENVREVANPEGEEVGPENFPEAVEMAANGEEINYQGASSAVDFDDNGDMEAVTYEIGSYSMDGYSVDETVEYEA